MPKKNYSSTGKTCRVTFKYPNGEEAPSGALTGSFNQWSLSATPMKRLKDGTLSVTISLAAGQTYPYRFVLDGGVWVNDPAAEGYVPNEYGEQNSLVTI
jgi:1,4-alpha-glucan branching enzyme